MFLTACVCAVVVLATVCGDSTAPVTVVTLDVTTPSTLEVPADLRHRRVTTWLAEGKSPALVQKAMGHSDLATTMGYAHLLDEDLLALVQADEEERALRALADA